jgi:acyl carrier protein
MSDGTQSEADRERLLDQIRDYVHEEREIDRDGIQEDTTFREDLSIDSLDLAAMALALEDEYEVRLEDHQIMTITTVGDALDLILASVARRRQVTGQPS